MEASTLKYHVEGPLAWITLDRPDKLNAISREMVLELEHTLDQAQKDDRVRVIVLRGEGRAFSAGFDLGEDWDDPNSSEEAFEALKQELYTDFDLIMRFWDSPKPTVAAVHGYCLGGAMELALACDITVAATGCRFGEPEVKFGSGIVALLMPYVCGPKRAKELLLTGNDRITAEQAESWGLVNQVVEPEQLEQAARDMAISIARNDALAVQLTKRAINNSYEIGKMREALKQALDLNIEIESTQTEESDAFNEILKNEGVKAAIAWRDRKLGVKGTGEKQ